MAAKTKTVRAKKGTKKASPKKLENREIIVRYNLLSDTQKKNLIKHIKKDDDYVSYLSGKFKFAFADGVDYTEATYIWKGGAGDWHEAYDRVMGLLSRNLPQGIASKSIVEKEV
jgi:hypothetical protein